MSCSALRFLAFALCPLSGCVAYNEQCQALVDNPSEKVATLGADLWLDRPNARHAPNALGQAVADSFVDVFAASAKPVDFAVLNGGSLRAEGLCGVTRNIVRANATGLTNGVLHEILLFENLVNAVDLTEDEVMAVMEHSVERLFAVPAPIISPAGSFLHVSKEVQLVVDCSRPPLSRITSLRIKGELVEKPGRVNKRFRMALSEFLLGGGDGYTMLAGPGKDPTRSPQLAQRFGGVDSNIAADYLRKNKIVDPLKLDPLRMDLQNCAKSVAPSN
ncbi:MAG: 5-nucleotidase [Myxococcaceae bacterium]|nr:5-nucleotidase [Myxococcaceae bacterium]